MKIRSRPIVLLVTLALVLSTAAAPAAAQSQPPWAQELYNDFSDMIPTYNEQVRNGELDLSLGDSLLTNQRVTVQVNDGSQTAYFWYDTNANKEITRSGMGEHPDGATLTIVTDRQTIEEIVDPANQNPVGSFKTAVQENRINFNGGTLNTIVLSFVVDIAQQLGLL